jgi:hypothetical protein
VAVVKVVNEVAWPPWNPLPKVEVAVVKYDDVAVLKLAPPLKPGTLTTPVETVKYVVVVTPEPPLLLLLLLPLLTTK